MPDQKQGYVYILTNPSFKDDWVKIGKSSRPVDVRSKELDNTAVPLPFEIYATLKTAKYNEVEKQIHKQIDRLTDLRIRQNREFFNIRPDLALDIFRDVATLLDDAEIEVINKEEVVCEVVKECKTTNKEDNPLYLFWVDFINYNKPNGPYANAMPTIDHWKSKGTNGIPGSTVDICVNKSRAKVEIYINSGSKERNKEIFDKLFEHKEQLESELGKLNWVRHNDKVTCSINTERALVYTHPEDRKKIFEFFVEYTDKFRYSFGKLANKI